MRLDTGLDFFDTEPILLTLAFRPVQARHVANRHGCRQHSLPSTTRQAGPCGKARCMICGSWMLSSGGSSMCVVATPTAADRPPDADGPCARPAAMLQL